MMRVQPLLHFNPRAHEGHDSDAGTCVYDPGFQSTCPRGARPARSFRPHQIIDFNPRAHEGHDESHHKEGYNVVFQSTCPRGARHILVDTIAIPIDFNPRAHEGHDPRRVGYVRVVHNFNPRAHEGHDFRTRPRASFGVFQSTCPRGARPRPARW